MSDSKYAYISFFSGLGAWDLGAYWAGARFDEHYFSEIDPTAIKVFKQRFPDAIPLGDITKLDESHFNKDKKYIFSGSFPCIDLSLAGKRRGLQGKHSGLWFDFLRLVGICKPVCILVENVAALATLGLDVVVAGLAKEGYSCCWRVISAADVGAPHLRERLWLIAYPSEADPLILPLSFKLNRRVCAKSGSSVMSLESVSYFDSYFVGEVQIPGDFIYFQNQSVGGKMPSGGALSNGCVFAIPAWEGGLDVKEEILEDANHDNRWFNEKGDSGSSFSSRGDQEVRASGTGNVAGAGVGHEDVANSNSSRWIRQSRSEMQEEELRGSMLGCEQYSELEGGWDVKPGFQCMVDGVPWFVGSRGDVPFPVIDKDKVSADHKRMLSCYGNALVPQIAWIIWRRIKPFIKSCYLG